MKTQSLVMNNVPTTMSVKESDPITAYWIHRRSWDYGVCSYCSFESKDLTEVCNNCGAVMTHVSKEVSRVGY